MDPLVKGAVAAAVLGALSSLSPARARPAGEAAAGAGGDGAGVLMPCGPRTIPDGTSCVPIPGIDEPLVGPDEPRAAVGSHPERGRGTVVYDHLPLLPNRPKDYPAYRYPLDVEAADVEVLSGYDLDRSAGEQRRTDHAIGHGALDLAAPRSAPVRALALEGQEGPSEVLYVGPLYGTTVVTSHTLKQARRLRVYLVLHGHLEAPAPGLEAGAKLANGELVGTVGDTGSPGNVHLHLEVRQVRPDVELAELDAARWVDQDVSIPCDPRNVLPLR